MSEVSLLLVVGAGVVVNIAITAVALSRTRKSPEVTPAAPPAARIDTGMIQAEATTAFTGAIDAATAQFKQDIHGSSTRLSELIVRLTTEVVERELETYRTELASAREQALGDLKRMRETLATKQTELETGIDREVAARKQELLQQLDAKLGTAVMAYVVERLGQGVDLGAQRDYLLASLERTKAELKQDLQDGL